MKNETVKSIWLDLPLKVSLPTENDTAPICCDWHLHKEIEVCLQLKNKKTFYVGDTVYELNPGDILIVPKYLPHRTLSSENAKNILLQYTDTSEEKEDLINLFPLYQTEKAVLISNNNDCQKQIFNVISTIAYEYKNRDYGCKQAIKSNLQYLTVLFNRYGILKKQTNNWDNSDFAEILSYVAQNYKKRIMIEEAADKFSFEKSYFCRRFKKNTGLTFISYVNKVRIFEARKMLLNSNLSIEDISLECGFNSTSYFVKCFKSEYNVTPFKYKNMFTVE